MRELRERAGQIVKALCLILAALVVYQLAGMVIRWNPFRGVVVPELPVLTAATNGPAEGAHQTNLLAATAGKGTNNPSCQPSTNSSLPLASAKTNSVANSITAATLAEKGTTSVVQVESPLAGTNAITNTVANTTGDATTNATTNTAGTMAADASPPLRKSSTNTATMTATNTVTNTATITTTNAATNVLAAQVIKSGGTNPVPALLSTNQGTNLVASAAATGTNGAAAKFKKHLPPGAPMPEMAGKHGTDLLPAVQARIQQITESELLAPVMHPLPMALLGIAGEVAFLRSANGQTGLVKEGDSLDDIKLLRIGVNRVLIEQDGQKKELMIFSGYGSESLLPKDSSNETNHP